MHDYLIGPYILSSSTKRAYHTISCSKRTWQYFSPVSLCLLVDKTDPGVSAHFNFHIKTHLDATYPYRSRLSLLLVKSNLFRSPHDHPLPYIWSEGTVITLCTATDSDYYQNPFCRLYMFGAFMVFLVCTATEQNEIKGL